jgi:hypothetical protein
MRGTGVAIALAVVGCGRIGFDAAGDDGSAFDGTPGDGSSGTPDAAPPVNDACANATVLVVDGGSIAGTVAGATDDLDTLFCPDGPEVVYRFDLSNAGDLRLRFNPTFFASLTTTSSCPPSSFGCTTVDATDYSNVAPFQPGDNYILVDYISGAGASFEIGLETVLPGAN